MGGDYGERAIAASRSFGHLKTMLDIMWINRHGSPNAFSADPEFCKDSLKKILQSQNISLLPRPSRSSHKNGIVERNNSVFKFVLKKHSKKIRHGAEASLVSRASFVADLLHGSSVLSAIQMVRGYSPSIVGLPARIVPKGIFDAHIQLIAHRA